MNNKTLFVLMPFRPDLDEIYKDIIKPTVERLGLVCIRADEEVGPSLIMNDVWRFIQGGDLFIADLTGKNPNVFYELGLAHAQDKIVVLMTQDCDDVPFDLRHLRVIEYKNTQNGRAGLSLILKETFETIIAQINRPETRNRYIVFGTSESDDLVVDLKKTAFELAIDLTFLELKLFDIRTVSVQNKEDYANEFIGRVNNKLKILNIPYPLPGWVNLLPHRNQDNLVIEFEERDAIWNVWFDLIREQIKSDYGIWNAYEFGRHWYTMTLTTFWDSNREKEIENFVYSALHEAAYKSGVSRKLIDRMVRRYKRYMENEYPHKQNIITRYYSRLRDEILECYN